MAFLTVVAMVSRAYLSLKTSSAVTVMPEGSELTRKENSHDRMASDTLAKHPSHSSCVVSDPTSFKCAISARMLERCRGSKSPAAARIAAELWWSTLKILKSRS